MNGARVIAAACVLAACAPQPPEFLSDDAEAHAYADVLHTARRELGLGDTLIVHPHRGVDRDSAGQPRLVLDEFEYAPAAALELIAARDSSVRLCTPAASGKCDAGAWLVLSGIRRIEARDAVVTVLSLDESDARRESWLIVRLRYLRPGWTVAGSERVD